MAPATSPLLQTVELFAGAAGLAQGFERAGSFETAALYDIFEPARQSYLLWRHDACYRNVDISALEAADILRDLDGRPVHGVLGGPPCQGFSIAGKRQGDAETNKLVKVYAGLIERLLPPFLVLENVPQLRFHKYFLPLVKQLERHYHITYGVLNAARYGVPQTRHRLILVGYRKDLGVVPSLPPPTHGKLGQELYSYSLRTTNERVRLEADTAEAIFGADPVIAEVVRQQRGRVDIDLREDLLPLVTVGEAISDLAAGSSDDTPISYADESQGGYQRQLRSPEGMVRNCAVRRHVGKPLEIATSLREGGTPSNEPGFDGKKYFSQAYSRLHRAGLARTITTFFQNAGSGRFLHYEEPRTLTIREGARLQGFHDDFVFVGSLADRMQLVGNAVPLQLAEALGRHILDELGPVLLD